MVKYIKRIILYLVIVLIHFFLQSSMMLLSYVSEFIFYEEPFWSVGGLLSVISSIMYKILAFPFVWIVQKFSITFPWSEEIPFFLNSILWGGVIFALLITRSNNKQARYQFVRGGSR